MASHFSIDGHDKPDSLHHLDNGHFQNRLVAIDESRRHCRSAATMSVVDLLSGSNVVEVWIFVKHSPKARPRRPPRMMTAARAAAASGTTPRDGGEDEEATALAHPAASD